jgi:hypothetical protein
MRDLRQLIDGIVEMIESMHENEHAPIARDMLFQSASAALRRAG